MVPRIPPPTGTSVRRSSTESIATSPCCRVGASSANQELSELAEGLLQAVPYDSC